MTSPALALDRRHLADFLIRHSYAYGRETWHTALSVESLQRRGFASTSMINSLLGDAAGAGLLSLGPVRTLRLLGLDCDENDSADDAIAVLHLLDGRRAVTDTFRCEELLPDPIGEPADVVLHLLDALITQANDALAPMDSDGS